MTKNEVLDVRLTSQQKDLLRHAAAIRGLSMTDFVLSIVMPVAHEVVDTRNAIRLTQTAWNDFLALLDQEPQVSPIAREEAADFLARLRSDQP